MKLLNEIYLKKLSDYLNGQSKDYIKYRRHNVSSGWGIATGNSDFYIKNGWMPEGYEYVDSIGYTSGHNWSGYAIAYTMMEIQSSNLGLM